MQGDGNICIQIIRTAWDTYENGKKRYDFDRKLGTQACHELRNKIVEDAGG